MGKLAIVFYLMAYVVSSQSVTANRRPLRSVLAPAGKNESYACVDHVRVRDHTYARTIVILIWHVFSQPPVLHVCQIFCVVCVETIANYKTVSPIIINQSAETTHVSYHVKTRVAHVLVLTEIIQGYPHNLWIKFDMPGETFELHLTMNKYVQQKLQPAFSIDTDAFCVLQESALTTVY